MVENFEIVEHDVIDQEVEILVINDLDVDYIIVPVVVSSDDLNEHLIKGVIIYEHDIQRIINRSIFFNNINDVDHKEDDAYALIELAYEVNDVVVFFNVNDCFENYYNIKSIILKRGNKHIIIYNLAMVIILCFLTYLFPFSLLTIVYVGFYLL